MKHLNDRHSSTYHSFSWMYMAVGNQIACNLTIKIDYLTCRLSDHPPSYYMSASGHLLASIARAQLGTTYVTAPKDETSTLVSDSKGIVKIMSYFYATL